MNFLVTFPSEGDRGGLTFFGELREREDGKTNAAGAEFGTGGVGGTGEGDLIVGRVGGDSPLLQLSRSAPEPDEEDVSTPFPLPLSLSLSFFPNLNFLGLSSPSLSLNFFFGTAFEREFGNTNVVGVPLEEDMEDLMLGGGGDSGGGTWR